MTDDTDVLTLLRKAAVDDAPALTLQVDDVVRVGRHRRRIARVVAIGAGAAVAAGAFTFAVAQDERAADPGPGPADHVTEEPSPYTAHMMPALLKAVTLPEFGDATPHWKTFDIAAWGDVEGRDPDVPLPEPLWDQASAWDLRGTTDDRGFDLNLTAGDFSGTEGDPEQYCQSMLAAGGLTCTDGKLADGRVVISQWARDDRGREFSVPGLGGPWFVQSVKVYRDGSGFVVTARQGVQASSLEQARADAWLNDGAMMRIASNPDVNLEKVLRYPNSSQEDAVSATENRSP